MADEELDLSDREAAGLPPPVGPDQPQPALPTYSESWSPPVPAAAPPESTPLAAPLPAAPNLICHGERPFRELIPYLQHADIGLQTLAYTPGAEWFADSLKMSQYTYCRLPIVAPSFLRSDRPHVYYYEPGDDVSIQQALMSAHAHDRLTISADGVLTWDELAATLAA